MCFIKMTMFQRGRRKKEKIRGKIKAMQICFSKDNVFFFLWPIRKKVIKKDETEGGRKVQKEKEMSEGLFVNATQ